MNSGRVSFAIFMKPAVTFSLKRNIHVAAVLNEKSLYEVLRVPENATQSEIKDAYYKLSKVYHPDIKKDDQALSMFRQITEAYDVLGNVKSRMQYDKGIGKDMAYDTTKEPFYASLYVDSWKKGGVYKTRAAEILDKKPIIDDYMAQEYRDRLAEFRMAKNNLYEHRQLAYGEYGAQRVFFCVCFSIGLGLLRFQEMAVGF